MVKKIHERPQIIAEAKHINNGPSIRTKVSANVVHEETMISMILSLANENRLPPDTWKDRLSLADDEDEADTALDIVDSLKCFQT
mmetsp:Transcript_10701/g.25750  ORF Transcript_10701/g.25750 Transcript_10701/m.25750 type:complete len:85 (+) Transcript_10701:1403-1657(+)